MFRYSVSITDLGFLYSKSFEFDLVPYSDVDFARGKIERKNTSGSCQFFRQALI